jgi:hypothetical protein
MNCFQALIHRMFTSAIRPAGIWAMSAIGTKRTLRVAPHMSAFGVKRTWLRPAVML